MATDLDLFQLLNTAQYLNNRLKIGDNTSHITEEINNKNNSIQLKKDELQNIKDATETYNREFIERENNMPAPKTFSTVQDWSLFILFAGYIAFCLGVLIYIFRFSNMPLMISIIFMLLAAILMILFVFMIQRFG